MYKKNHTPAHAQKKNLNIFFVLQTARHTCRYKKVCDCSVCLSVLCKK